jgi:hypothetical protein
MFSTLLIYCSQQCENMATAPQMSSDEYHATSALNSSRLKKFAEGEYKYWSVYESPDRPPQPAPTQAMIIGRAFHTLILESELFDSEFEVLTAECEDGRLKMGKDARERIKAAGKTALKISEVETLKGMADSLRANELFAKILRLGKTEFSWFWIDDGTECKVRFDIVVPPCHEFPRGAFCDAKTAAYSQGFADASPLGFGKTFYKLGYDIQTGHYAVGAMDLFCTEELPDVFFAAVEKSYPYLSAVYQLNRQQLNDSVIKRDDLVERLNNCKKINKWQAYENGEFITPRYILNNSIEEEVTLSWE